MRKLATIQTIKTLEKITGKDRIVYASFENVGFKVIVSKDFSVGEKVIYCEVDSLLPLVPEFEFLKKRSFVESLQRIRIKNIKMSGLYSEGIVFKTDILNSKILEIVDGMDVTDVLNIIKYDEEALYEKKPQKNKKSKWWQKIPALRWIYIYLNKKQSGMLPWPRWAQKSDETRAQNLNYIYDQYMGQEFYSTEKLDGCSVIYGLVKGKFVVCSRNLQLKKDAESHYWKYAIDNDLERIFKQVRKKHIPEDFYIQGELIGPKIQRNRYELSELQFFAFNVFFLKQGKYVNFDILREMLSFFKLNPEQSPKMQTVPFLCKFSWDIKCMEQLLALSKGRSLLNPNAHREGIVIRSVEIQPPDFKQSNMKSFKVINPDFEC